MQRQQLLEDELDDASQDAQYPKNSLLGIPDEIFERIARDVLESPGENKDGLTLTSQRSRHIVQPLLHLVALLKLIDCGEYGAVVNVLADRPFLLLKRINFVNRNGSLFENVTPLQLAFELGDEAICELIIDRFDDLTKLTQAYQNPNERVDGRGAALGQLNQRFPGWTQLSFDFDPLVATITNERDFTQELNRFKEFFTPRTIKVGMHSRVVLGLMAAYQMKEQIEKIHTGAMVPAHWGRSNGSISTFNNLVIIFLKKLLPATYLQAFYQGLRHVVNESGMVAVINRAALKVTKNTVLFPFVPSSLNLNNFFTSSHGCSEHRIRERPEPEHTPKPTDAEKFGLLHQHKMQRLESLRAGLKNVEQQLEDQQPIERKAYRF